MTRGDGLRDKRSRKVILDSSWRRGRCRWMSGAVAHRSLDVLLRVGVLAKQVLNLLANDVADVAVFPNGDIAETEAFLLGQPNCDDFR
jgi:hypothetical protein